MSLLEKINNDMTTALKAGEKDKLTNIRMIKSSIKNEEIKKGTELKDEDIVSIIVREIKQRKDANEEFKKGNRQDLVDKNLQEIKWISVYLPEQMTDEEVVEVINNAVKEVSPTSMSDMGKIMKLVLPKVKGKTDLGKVNGIIKQKLNNL